MIFFHQNLKILRKNKGLTQTEAGKEFGVTQAAYRMWEVDKKPSLETIVNLAKLFEVTLDDLLTVDMEKSGPPNRDRSGSSLPEKERAKYQRIITQKEMKILEMGDEMKVALDTLLKVGDFLGRFPVREEDEAEKAELLRLLEGLKD